MSASEYRYSEYNGVSLEVPPPSWINNQIENDTEGGSWGDFI